MEMINIEKPSFEERLWKEWCGLWEKGRFVDSLVTGWPGAKQIDIYESDFGQTKVVYDETMSVDEYKLVVCEECCGG